MKITRVVLRDYEGWYDELGALIFDGPLPDPIKLLQALGHTIETEVHPHYTVAHLKNEMPAAIGVVHNHIKTHNKLK